MRRFWLLLDSTYVQYYDTAAYNDILLTVSTASTLAPCSISTFTISACPMSAAYPNGVILFWYEYDDRMIKNGQHHQYPIQHYTALSRILLFSNIWKYKFVDRYRTDWKLAFIFFLIILLLTSSRASMRAPFSISSFTISKWLPTAAMCIADQPV